jgi:hypothetical protein
MTTASIGGLRRIRRTTRDTELLAPVYAWFTEGLDTRDLV